MEKSDSTKAIFLLKNFLRCAVVFFGLAQTWVSRYSVNSDAVSYLDIGDAYFRGDWNAAINSMWSPLYSWLLGAAMFLFKPSAEWEYPLAHFVNFGLFLLAFAAFEFFLREIESERTVYRQSLRESETILPEWIFLPICYLIFIWATLVLIKIKHIVPDLCVAAIIFTAAGLLVRLRKSENLWLFAAFGANLGIGYLAKAPMLPIGFALLICLFFLKRNSLNRWRQIIVCAACFAVFAVPFIAALSLSKNKITFSENGRINYVWHVNGVKKAHWQGENEGAGTPLHSTRKILEKPAVYEFGSPIRATYPVWYDPSYWYEGVELRFDLKRQLQKIIGQTFVELLPIFSLDGFSLALGFFGLLALSRDKRIFLRRVFEFWFLLIPSLAAIFLYLPIHVETRYIAPFVAVILISVFIGIERADFTKERLAMMILCAALIVSILPPTALMIQSNVFDLFGEKDTGDGYQLAAREARNFGVEANDKIASLGRANDFAAAWARLTKTKIVAEVYEKEDVKFFWESDFAVRETVYQAFRNSGARFVVTTDAPAAAAVEGWQQLAGTNVYVYSLRNYAAP